jgi:hypothetical protein
MVPISKIFSLKTALFDAAQRALNQRVRQLVRISIEGWMT